MTCFRVVQEAVTNVVRHSRASGATVWVAHRADQVELRITDDGCGMAPHDLAMFGRVGHRAWSACASAPGPWAGKFAWCRRR